MRQTLDSFTRPVRLILAGAIVGCLSWSPPVGAEDLPKELTQGGLLPLKGDEKPKDPDAPKATPGAPAPAADENAPTSVTAEMVGRIPDNAIESDPERIVRLWRVNWRLYAMRFAPLGDDYVSCATYDPRYPSSRGVTTSELISRATKTQQVRSGILVQTVTIAPDREDARLAAESLMDTKVGSYGQIHSAKVDAVLGDDKMVLSDLWLVDANDIKEQKKSDMDKVPTIQKPRTDTTRRTTGSRFNNNNGNRADYERYERERERRIEQQYEAAVKAREDLIKRIEAKYEAREKLADIQSKGDFKGPIVVEGYSTARVKQGARWTGDRPGQGIDLAIVGYDGSDSSKTSSRTSSRSRSSGRLVAVPPHLFRRAMSEEQFMAMLKSRDVSIGEFVNEILKAKTKSSDGTGSLVAEEAVFDYLESRRGKAPAAEKTADAAKVSATGR